MPGGLAAEALGMLWAVLQDFRQWGAVRTITALDPRFEQSVPGLSRKTLPADEVIWAEVGDHEEVYLSLLKRCDAVLVIAPETDGILSRLAEQAETEGIPLLGCSTAAVATAGIRQSAAGCLIWQTFRRPKPVRRLFQRLRTLRRRLGAR